MEQMISEDAVREEYEQLFLERQTLQKEREQFERERREKAPRRYRAAAFLVDVWSTWIVAKLIAVVVPYLSTSTIWTIVYVLTVVTLTARTGQSLGKMAFELKVVSSDGQPLRVGNVVIRETVGKFITVASVFGLFVPFFNVRQQAVHDLIAVTGVISVDDRPVRNRKEG